MVDTLYLETENFYLKSDEKFLVQGNSKQPELNVLFSASGVTPRIVGTSAYFTWTPRISHRTSVQFRITTRQFRKFLSIQIASLPRILHMANIYPLDTKEEYDRAINELKAIAEESGIIIFNWYELLITRMDLSGTFITKRRTEVYLDIIKSSSLRGNQKVIRREGVEFHAQKSTYAFYDKAAQMKAIDEYLNDELLHPPGEDKFKMYISTKSIKNHLLRVEFRFREFASVKANFSNVRTLGDLLNNSDELFIKYFEIFSRVLNQMDGTALIRKTKKAKSITKLNTISPDETPSDSAKPSFNSSTHSYSAETLRALMKQAKEEHLKHWLSGLVMDFGYLYIEQNFGSDFYKKLREFLTSDTKNDRERSSAEQQGLRLKKNAGDALKRAGKYLNILAPTSTYYEDFAEFKSQIHRYLSTEYEDWKTKVMIPDDSGKERPYGYDTQIINLDPILRKIYRPTTGEELAKTLREIEDDFANFPYMVRLKLPHGESERLKKIKLSRP